MSLPKPPSTPFQVYTVRMGFIDTTPWQPASILSLYKSPLKSSRFTTTQLPIVSYPPITSRLTPNDPFPSARTITITSPTFGEFSQTRDTSIPLHQDPSHLAETGKAFLTTFTWNLCRGGDGKDDSAAIGALRDIFRKVRPRDGAIKLSPRVSKWEDVGTWDAYPGKGERPDCGGGPVAAEAGGGTGWLWGVVGMVSLGVWYASKR